LAVSTIQEIEQAALRLTDEERLKLTDRLLSSLPAPSAPLVSESILAEAERRDAELDNGTVRLLSEEEFWRGVRRGGT